MRVVCQMGILKQASVSVIIQTFNQILIQPLFRYRRCFSFCSPGQSDGRRSRCSRDDSISCRQTDRHAACSPGDKSLLSPALCRALGILCNLGRQNITRREELLTLFCIQELSADAEIVDVRFTKSVIASKCAFTYEEAQIRKDDPFVTLFSSL